jgi:hypothetical protein
MDLQQPALLKWGVEVRRCIEECLNCHLTCLTTARYSIEKGGQYAEEKLVRGLLDCSQICHVCVTLLHSSPDLQGRVCGICAEYCERTAPDCEGFGGDAQLKVCAEACRQCATRCRGAASGQ